MKKISMSEVRGQGVSGAFVFLLLGVFAVLSTLMVLLSAQLYRVTVDQTRYHNDQRVLGSYLMNVVRGNDAASAVRVAHYDDTDVLCLVSGEGDESYITYVYCWDGTLRELFASAKDAFVPENGERICPAQAFRPEVEGALLTMHCVDGRGRAQALQSALHCAPAEGEVQP